MNKYAEHIKNLMIIEGARVAAGYDDAIIGYTKNSNNEYVIVYSANKIINILVDRDGMDEEEAWQYFDFNIEGSYVGSRTPIYLYEEYSDTSFYKHQEDDKQQDLFKETKDIIKRIDKKLDDLLDEPEMWKHFCHVERSDMAIGKGESCNWCGEEENESRS